jgi:uncharacterized protein
MTLATTAQGDVWAAAVFYVNQDTELVFLSFEHTRHARHIAMNPWAAAAIQEDYAAWQNIKGIQLEGPVEQLHGDKRDRAVERYREKYPFVTRASGKMATALAQTNWYQITPVRMYFIDNSKGLGHRDEVPLHQAEAD